MKPSPHPSRANPWGVIKTVGNAVAGGKQPLIKYVEFNITGRCQAGCLSCPVPRAYTDEKKVKDPIDLEGEFKLFKSYFVKLKKYGLKFVTIYGREPLLWDQEADEPNEFLKKMIIWLSRDLGVRVCLATSGIGLKEPVVKVLFDQKGILFMKDWGSKNSVEKLIRHKGAYRLIRQGWELVKKVSKRYKNPGVIAEFLYTGINRSDLLAFWKNCARNGFIPFVEVPVVKGNCAKNYKQLKTSDRAYVRDIYELSLLNLSLRYRGLSRRQVRVTDIWQPPYGSVFPSPCDKLTRGKGVFLERDGNLSVCCGVNERLGNIQDSGIKRKLQNSPLLKRIRLAYEYLGGSCKDCDYSKRFHLCYGCRGNAYTYRSQGRGPFAYDPMCFGKIAYGLAVKGELNGFMSRGHINKILKYFKN